MFLVAFTAVVVQRPVFNAVSFQEVLASVAEVDLSASVAGANIVGANAAEATSACSHGCQCWFDGCNTCSCTADGALGDCTKATCIAQGMSECTSYDCQSATDMWSVEKKVWCSTTTTEALSNQRRASVPPAVCDHLSIADMRYWPASQRIAVVSDKMKAAAVGDATGELMALMYVSRGTVLVAILLIMLLLSAKTERHITATVSNINGFVSVDEYVEWDTATALLDKNCVSAIVVSQISV